MFQSQQQVSKHVDRLTLDPFLATIVLWLLIMQYALAFAVVHRIKRLTLDFVTCWHGKQRLQCRIAFLSIQSLPFDAIVLLLCVLSEAQPNRKNLANAEKTNVRPN